MTNDPNTQKILQEMDTAASDWKNLHMSLVLDVSYPPHIDRSLDPYISVFEATRSELMKEDPHCWRCGTGEDLEAHHKIQWAYFPIIDIDKLKRDFPEFQGTTEDEKQVFLNSRSNIVLLCRNCHTGNEGRHKIPDPLWQVRRYLADDNEKITVQVNEKSPSRSRLKTLSQNSENTAPKTLIRPLSKMKISSSLRRLLK